MPEQASFVRSRDWVEAMLSSLCLASLINLACATAPVKLQDGVDVVGWRRGVRGDASTSLDVKISLKNRNMDKLNLEILAVSSPNSPRYGQHLTKEEITALTS